jgi:hypothetical protein
LTKENIEDLNDCLEGLRRSLNGDGSSMAPAAATIIKRKPYKPRSADAKAIVDLLERGETDYAKISRRTLASAAAVRQTAKRWNDAQEP